MIIHYSGMEKNLLRGAITVVKKMLSKEDYEDLIDLLEIANEFFKRHGCTLLIIECQNMIEKLKANYT